MSSSSTADDYYKKWYEENKDERNRRRREKYAQDEEYRQKVLEHSREYREKKRKERPKVKLPRFQKPREVTIDGETINLFSVGAFAQFIGRSVQSISHWERNGILPETPYRDSRGFRFYTRDMMLAVKEEVGDKDRLFPVDPKMVIRISDAWADQGVPVGDRIIINKLKS